MTDVVATSGVTTVANIHSTKLPTKEIWFDFAYDDRKIGSYAELWNMKKLISFHFPSFLKKK